MSSVSAALGNAGGGIPFDLEGVTYEVGYLTQKVKADFEKYLERRDLSRLPEFREFLAPEEYTRERDKLLDSIKRGDYGFHSEKVQAEMVTPLGALALAAILFGVDSTEMGRIAIQAGPERIKEVLARVAAHSAPTPKEGGEKKG